MVSEKYRVKKERLIFWRETADDPNMESESDVVFRDFVKF
jgi:hypothetical protein